MKERTTWRATRVPDGWRRDFRTQDLERESDGVRISRGAIDELPEFWACERPKVTNESPLFHALRQFGLDPAELYESP